MLLASSLVCAFLSLGCKQDVGGRCEQPSDCASGYCSGQSVGANVDPNTPHTCTPGPATPTLDAAPMPTPDAAATGDAAAEAAAETGGDAAGDAASEVGDAASEALPEGGADAATVEAGGDADGSAGDVATEAATSG